MQSAEKSVLGGDPSLDKKEKGKLLAYHDQIIKQSLQYSIIINCHTGEKIILPGDDSRSFYYVNKGTVEVSYMAGETKITVAIIGAGNFCGEIGFFDGGSRVRDVKAIEDAEIRVFNQDSLERMQLDEPGLYAGFIGHLAKGICGKFRRILEESEPLIAYGASLSSRRRSFAEARPLPDSLTSSKEWRKITAQVEEFKAHIYDLSYNLQAVQGDEIPDDLRYKGYKILDVLNDSLAVFKDMMPDQESEDMMWGFVFKEIFPYFMRSRFTERAYYKPKGYAGDFLLMEHIYQNKPDGDGKMGLLVDSWCMQRPSANAIRGRRILMAEQLARISRERLQSNDIFEVMNLACGPCRELFDFLKDCDYSEKINALCVDIDDEALQYSNSKVNICPHNASIRYMKENLVKWALGKTNQTIGAKDMIYSAGLFDYLEPRLFCRLVNKCHEHLKPGGSLLIGNFAPYSDILLMSHIAHWVLLYRTEDELRELFKNTNFGTDVSILSEPEGINLFVLAVKQ
jgi:CRP-like cAMP-binding protein/SAM-dependent methyltransferase